MVLAKKSWKTKRPETLKLRNIHRYICKGHNVTSCYIKYHPVRYSLLLYSVMHNDYNGVSRYTEQEGYSHESTNSMFGPFIDIDIEWVKYNITCCICHDADVVNTPGYYLHTLTVNSARKTNFFESLKCFFLCRDFPEDRKRVWNFQRKQVQHVYNKLLFVCCFYFYFISHNVYIFLQYL